MTAAERKARERERKRAAGLKKVELWLTPEQEKAVQAFVASFDASLVPIFDTKPI